MQKNSKSEQLAHRLAERFAARLGDETTDFIRNGIDVCVTEEIDSFLFGGNETAQNIAALESELAALRMQLAMKDVEETDRILADLERKMSALIADLERDGITMPECGH